MQIGGITAAGYRRQKEKGNKGGVRLIGKNEFLRQVGRAQWVLPAITLEKVMTCFLNKKKQDK
jgi:hypothetical protein